MRLDLIVVSTACFTSINRNIYKLFAQKGYSVTIIVPSELQFGRITKTAEPARADDPPIIFLKLRGNNPRISQFENLIKVLDREKPKRVLLDYEPVSITAINIGKWCRKNHALFYCLTYENLSLGIGDTMGRLGYRSVPVAFIKRILLGLSRKYVKGLFTINNEGTRVYVDEGFKNVVKIPLGFDPEVFRIDNESREKIRKLHSIDTTAIAYFGRVSREKGVHILVSALSRLMHHDWVFVIDEFSVYKNEYNGVILEQLENTRVINRVIFINPNHQEIAGYMNAADVVVIPSISTPRWVEQYGRVAPESMACGKLVIAADTGALPMLLNNHGHVFKEGDVDALTELLEDFLTNRSTNNHSVVPEEISKYTHENLSIHSQYKAMMDVFDKE